MNKKEFRLKQLRGARIADLFEAFQDVKASTEKKLEQGMKEGDADTRLMERLEAFEIVEYIIHIYFPEYPLDGDDK